MDRFNCFSHKIETLHDTYNTPSNEGLMPASDRVPETTPPPTETDWVEAYFGKHSAESVRSQITKVQEAAIAKARVQKLVESTAGALQFQAQSSQWTASSPMTPNLLHRQPIIPPYSDLADDSSSSSSSCDSSDINNTTQFSENSEDLDTIALMVVIPNEKLGTTSRLAISCMGHESRVEKIHQQALDDNACGGLLQMAASKHLSTILSK